MATIEIKVTFDSKKESLEQALANLLTAKSESDETYKQLSLFDKPENQPAPETVSTATETVGADAPADPAPEPKAEAATADEPKQVSQADVRALAVALSKTNKPALKAIFKELGVASFSGVKAEDYPVFYEKLAAANG